MLFYSIKILDAIAGALKIGIYSSYTQKNRCALGLNKPMKMHLKVGDVEERHDAVIWRDEHT